VIKSKYRIIIITLIESITQLYKVGEYSVIININKMSIYSGFATRQQ
jgi:hypothetical protein